MGATVNGMRREKQSQRFLAVVDLIVRRPGFAVAVTVVLWLLDWADQVTGASVGRESVNPQVLTRRHGSQGFPALHRLPWAYGS
jgi:hypothetical protein